MDKSETIGKLAEALAKAQGAFGKLKKSRTVDFVTRGGQKIKYSYAELADVLEVIRKPLSDNGLAITQTQATDGTTQVLQTTLMHSSGEWLASYAVLLPQDKGPQSEGSALTYARRYSISAIVGIASEEDDDGEAAMPPHVDKAQTPQPVTQPAQAATPMTKPLPATIEQYDMINRLREPLSDDDKDKFDSWVESKFKVRISDLNVNQAAQVIAALKAREGKAQSPRK